jgi:hypothetical protein
MRGGAPLLLIALATTTSAHAQSDGGVPGDGGSAPPAPVILSPEETARRFQALEERIARVEDENRELRRVVSRSRSAASLSIADGVQLRLGGYLDVGAFKAFGDGVAYVRDAGHLRHPELADFPWVFLGDPWSNPVNAQGDSADLGLDRTNIARFDPIRSGGKLSFIANMVNLNLAASLGDHFFMESSINFEPRQGNLGSPGDVFDVDLAYIEFKPWPAKLDLHIFAGKFESTFGIEYRNRKAPDRFNVTPSIISRYTVGTPTGLKVRGSFLDGLITYNVALTNGAMSTERFSHFYNEIDRNSFKTISGRVSIGRKLKSAPIDFDIGASGIFGAQDLAGRENLFQWQVGADLRLAVRDLTIRAEYLHSVANERHVAGIPWLHANGAYAEAQYQIFTWLGAFVRVDWRGAQLFTPPNLYLTDTLRVTAALRVDINFNLMVKLEYLRVQELSGPEIDDDVVSASAVFRM